MFGMPICPGGGGGGMFDDGRIMPGGCIGTAPGGGGGGWLRGIVMPKAGP